MRIDPKKLWLSRFAKSRQKKKLAILEQFEDITGIEATELLDVTRKRMAEGQPPTEAAYWLRIYRNELIESGHAKTSVCRGRS